MSAASPHRDAANMHTRYVPNARDITGKSRLMGDPAGGILQKGLLADDIIRVH